MEIVQALTCTTEREHTMLEPAPNAPPPPEWLRELMVNFDPRSQNPEVVRAPIVYRVPEDPETEFRILLALWQRNDDGSMKQVFVGLNRKDTEGLVQVLNLWLAQP